MSMLPLESMPPASQPEGFRRVTVPPLMVTLGRFPSAVWVPQALMPSSVEVTVMSPPVMRRLYASLA